MAGLVESRRREEERRQRSELLGAVPRLRLAEREAVAQGPLFSGVFDDPSYTSLVRLRGGGVVAAPVLATNESNAFWMIGREDRRGKEWFRESGSRAAGALAAWRAGAGSFQEAKDAYLSFLDEGLRRLEERRDSLPEGSERRRAVERRIREVKQLREKVATADEEKFRTLVERNAGKALPLSRETYRIRISENYVQIFGSQAVLSIPLGGRRRLNEEEMRLIAGIGINALRIFTRYLEGQGYNVRLSEEERLQWVLHGRAAGRYRSGLWFIELGANAGAVLEEGRTSRILGVEARVGRLLPAQGRFNIGFEARGGVGFGRRWYLEGTVPFSFSLGRNRAVLTPYGSLSNLWGVSIARLGLNADMVFPGGQSVGLYVEEGRNAPRRFGLRGRVPIGRSALTAQIGAAQVGGRWSPQGIISLEINF